MPEKIGRYEIERELGRGGMAMVYLARDPLMDRLVAVKVLPRQFTFDPNFRRRFQREAKIIARLEHPAIVPVYDFGEYDDQPYLVMRHMVGGSLRGRLKNGPLPLDEVARLYARLAPGLDRAHGQKIVHRDLKPDNVLFDDEGLAYLADFGIARLAEASQTMTVAGTPQYMSPEQVHGKRQIDGRADIYALGAMLFELLSGLPPYTGETNAQLMFKHAYEPTPNVLAVNPALPAAAQTVIEKAMAKEPDDRYDTAAEMAAALRDASVSPLTIETTQSAQAGAPLEETMIEEPPVVPVEAQEQDETAIEVPQSSLEAIKPEASDPSKLPDAEETALDTPQPSMASAEAKEEPESKDIPEQPKAVRPEVVAKPIAPAVTTNRPKSGQAADRSATGRARGATIANDPDARGWLIPAVGVALIVVLLLFIGLRSLLGGNGEEETPTPENSGVAVVAETPKPSRTVGSPATAAILTRDSGAAGTSTTPPTLQATPTRRPTATVPPTFTPDDGRPPLNASLGDTWTRPQDGMVMVYVPEGSFMMGSAAGDDDANDDEIPQHEVALDAFWLDRTEVTNAQYEMCMADGDCGDYRDFGSDFNGDDQPVVGVTWDDATDYCTWAGGLLPTEAQWEYAARGPEGLKYPWGNGAPSGNLLNYDGNIGRTTEVGSYPSGESWVGALDMAGNVWEWVADWYDGDYYDNSPRNNPSGPSSGQDKVLRGGSWLDNARDVRGATRPYYTVTVRLSLYLGFRCSLPQA